LAYAIKFDLGTAVIALLADATAAYERALSDAINEVGLKYNVPGKATCGELCEDRRMNAKTGGAEIAISLFAPCSHRLPLCSQMCVAEEVKRDEIMPCLSTLESALVYVK